MPAGTKFFTIDVRSAFFTMPADEGGRYLPAFMWEGKHSTWTVLPQALPDSPSYCHKF